MHTDDFEHFTHRERREILRWRAWDAKIALDQAVEARQKAAAKHRAGEAATLDDWTDLRHALGTELKARQKYDSALEDYNSSSPTTVPASAASESSPRDGSRSIRAPVQIHRVIRRPCRH
jgi:hypothetical protein